MNSQEGQSHLNFYPITHFPYVSIIDTLTGERVKVWNNAVTVSEFIEQGMEIIDKSKHHAPVSSPESQALSIMSDGEFEEENNDVLLLDSN